MPPCPQPREEEGEEEEGEESEAPSPPPLATDCISKERFRLIDVGCVSILEGFSYFKGDKPFRARWKRLLTPTVCTGRQPPTWSGSPAGIRERLGRQWAIGPPTFSNEAYSSRSQILPRGFLVFFVLLPYCCCKASGGDPFVFFFVVPANLKNSLYGF